jgi:hypothetical protein
MYLHTKLNKSIGSICIILLPSSHKLLDIHSARYLPCLLTALLYVSMRLLEIAGSNKISSNKSPLLSPRSIALFNNNAATSKNPSKAALWNAVYPSYTAFCKINIIIHSYSSSFDIHYHEYLYRKYPTTISPSLDDHMMQHKKVHYIYTTSNY